MGGVAFRVEIESGLGLGLRLGLKIEAWGQGGCRGWYRLLPASRHEEVDMHVFYALNRPFNIPLDIRIIYFDDRPGRLPR